MAVRKHLNPERTQLQEEVKSNIQWGAAFLGKVLNWAMRCKLGHDMICSGYDTQKVLNKLFIKSIQFISCQQPVLHTLISSCTWQKKKKKVTVFHHRISEQWCVNMPLIYITWIIFPSVHALIRSYQWRRMPWLHTLAVKVRSMSSLYCWIWDSCSCRSCCMASANLLSNSFCLPESTSTRRLSYRLRISRTSCRQYLSFQLKP